MLLAPQLEPPPPPIEAPAPRLIAPFTPELRSILSGARVLREPSVPSLGRYMGNGQIRLQSGIPNYDEVLGHELMHMTNYEYEPFAADQRTNWSGLGRAIASSYGSIPPSLLNDPPHAFVWLGQQSMSDPAATPLDIYRYFLPLRQGVLTD